MTTYNTDTIESLKFRPHGNVEWTTLEEGIVIYRAQGPFNKELTEALIELETTVYPEFKEKWELGWISPCL